MEGQFWVGRFLSRELVGRFVGEEQPKIGKYLQYDLQAS